MNKTYVVSFSDKSLSNKKILIHSESNLKPEELASLKTKYAGIRSVIGDSANRNKEIISISWKDLEVKQLLPGGDQSELAMTVTKVAVNAIKQLPKPALITRLEALVDAWPSDIPIVYLIWHLLLSPLLFIGRFLSRNRENLIRDLNDLDQTFHYNSSEQYLKEYSSHIELLLKGLEGQGGAKVEELKKYLEEMKSNGELLHSA
jgi:hypothetical protein